MGRSAATRRRIGRAAHALALRLACSAGTALAACWRSSGAGQAAGAAPLKVGVGAGGGDAHAPGRVDGLLRARWWEWPDDDIIAAVPLLESADIAGLIAYARTRENFRHFP